MSSSERPFPVATADSRPFWQFTGDHELRVPRCTDCGVLRYPPTARCGFCLSPASEWVLLSGRATLTSWTTVRDAFVPGIPTPYHPAEVELVEQAGLSMITQLVDLGEDDLRPGKELAVSWLDTHHGYSLPLFAPVRPS
ncbi:Zn-ribbon domain-containing OB-fold protein [Nocardioides sp.]|uniref:Zn-ribbon domain-containing OB-fold protein n=1 Tax=Nocardioides sp. TaxID=35761 RepID=UPI003D136DA1